MPRHARLDMEGQTYHVMSRGIERRPIFSDDDDYQDFYERISHWVNETGAKCYAWCLMPNHFHLLIERGVRPLSEIMHRVQTGYAVHFNHKYGRCGHLFQNRYKAKTCGREEYLHALVPYIHLNPLRAKLVAGLDELAGYKWCGHKAITDGVHDKLLKRHEVLAQFGHNETDAAANYLRILAERMESGDTEIPSEDTGLDQEVELAAPDAAPAPEEFRETALAKRNAFEILAQVEAATGIRRAYIFSRTRERTTVKARACYCYLAREQSGLSVTRLASDLGLTQSAASKLVLRGRSIWSERLNSAIVRRVPILLS